MNIVQKSEPNFYEGHDNGISTVIDVNGERQSKIVLIDGDSLPFICGYQKDFNEFGEPIEPYTLENGGFEIAEGILDEKLLGIYNSIEQYFDIISVFICVKGHNNPRKSWFNEYKSHRKETPDVVKHLHNYLIEKHSAKPAEIGEADDLIKTMSDRINGEGIIVGIDKDLLAINSIHYNFSKDIWQYVDYKTSRYNFWTQVLIGDNVDFKGLSPSIGSAYARKNLSIDFTEEQYQEAVFLGFMKAWKNNKELALKNMQLSHDLVKLWDIEELTKINNKYLEI